MDGWSEVASKIIELTNHPKKLIILASFILLMVIITMTGFAVYEHYQPKRVDSPPVQQENKGDRNQGAGTNNGQMNQTNH